LTTFAKLSNLGEALDLTTFAKLSNLGEALDLTTFAKLSNLGEALDLTTFAKLSNLVRFELPPIFHHYLKTNTPSNLEVPLVHFNEARLGTRIRILTVNDGVWRMGEGDAEFMRWVKLSTES